MAGVDEPDQPVGAAVRFVHGVPEHAVVAPAVRAAERVDRHQLDEVDAEIDQIVQLLDRRVEGAVRGERADVQFVDHRALDRAARPVAVGPRVGRRLPQLRALVHAVGLARRAGIGQHLGVVVEHEAVAGVRSARRRAARHQPSSERVIGCSVPSTSRRTARVAAPTPRTRGQASRSSSATGSSANRSARRLGPLILPPREPVGPRAVGQRQNGVAPAGFGRAARVQRLTATSTSSPRRNATTCSAAGPSASTGV